MVHEWPLQHRNLHWFKMDRHYSSESGYPEIQDYMGMGIIYLLTTEWAMNVTLQILPTNVKWHYVWNIYGHVFGTLWIASDTGTSTL